MNIPLPPSAAFEALCDWGNLQRAYARAAAGKRGRPAVAAFDHRMADHLVHLRDELRAGRYSPQPYTQF